MDERGAAQRRTERLTRRQAVGSIILTMGLEFRRVVGMGPQRIREEQFRGESDFDRMLLYLACTRARHQIELSDGWDGMGPRPPCFTGRRISTRVSLPAASVGTGGSRIKPLPDGCQTGGRDGSPHPRGQPGEGG